MAATRWFVVSAALLSLARATLVKLVPECADCTGRKDVPCRIEILPYPCDHTEVHTKWPGEAHNLNVKQVAMNNDSQWLANFTWSPPYDASLYALTGFVLTVNMRYLEYLHSGGVPECFFANLSGTDWSKVTEPQDVVFHFDCVRVDHRAAVHLSLTSAPMPSEKATITHKQIDLGPKDVEDETEKVFIGFKVFSNNTVVVNFGPKSNKTHEVCLAPGEYLATCDWKQKVEQGRYEAVFHNVKKGNYSVMIMRPGDKFAHVSRQYLIVPERRPPSIEDPKLNHMTIIFITLAALMFIMVSTTAVFCIIRKNDVCGNRPWSHQRPNNSLVNSDESTRLVVGLCYNESPSYMEAVKQFSAIVNKATSYQVVFPHEDCIGREDLQKISEKYREHHVLVFLSRTVLELLTDMDGQTTPIMDSQQEFLRMTLDRNKTKDRDITYVSFIHLESNDVPVHGCSVYCLTDIGNERVGTSMSCPRMNTDNLCSVLNRITGISCNQNDLSYESHKEDLDKLLSCLQRVSLHDFSSRNDESVSDQGYKSGDYVPLQHPEDLALVDAGARYPQCHEQYDSYNSATLCWVNDQKQLHSQHGVYAHQNGGERMGHVPLYGAAHVPVPTYTRRDHGDSVQLTMLKDKIAKSKQYPRGVAVDPRGVAVDPRGVAGDPRGGGEWCNGVRMCPNGSAARAGAVEDDWEAPDWDNGSDTQSMLCQEQMKINQNYMANTKRL